MPETTLPMTTLPTVQAESHTGRFHIVGTKLFVIFDVPGTGILGKVSHSEYLTIRDGKFVTGVCTHPIDLNMVEPLVVLGESRTMSKAASDAIAAVDSRVDDVNARVDKMKESGLTDEGPDSSS